MINVFIAETLCDYTDEDKILGKFKKSSTEDYFKSFNKANPAFAQILNDLSVSKEEIQLVDNKIAVPERFRKPVLNHLRREHPYKRR